MNCTIEHGKLTVIRKKKLSFSYEKGDTCQYCGYWATHQALMRAPWMLQAEVQKHHRVRDRKGSEMQKCSNHCMSGDKYSLITAGAVPSLRQEACTNKTRPQEWANCTAGMHCISNTAPREFSLLRTRPMLQQGAAVDCCQPRQPCWMQLLWPRGTRTKVPI